MALRDMAARLFAPLRVDFPPEEKASKTGPLIAFHMHGQPVWTPRNYADLAREGFTKNAVVYRCVRMISETAASVHLDAFDGEKLLDAHPLLELLAKPNATQCAPDLFETWYGSARQPNDWRRFARGAQVVAGSGRGYRSVVRRPCRA